MYLVGKIYESGSLLLDFGNQQDLLHGLLFPPGDHRLPPVAKFLVGNSHLPQNNNLLFCQVIALVSLCAGFLALELLV